MASSGMNWGIRSLADGFFRYFQPSNDCYLRIQNVVNTPGDYSSLGFLPTVSGGQSGVTDILITPPADVQDVSLHNIGLLGERLNFGSRIFIISHTFVQNRMDLLGITADATMIWRSPSVVGLYYSKRLYSIESITTETVGGHTTLWKLVGNLLEYPTSSAGQLGS